MQVGKQTEVLFNNDIFNRFVVREIIRASDKQIILQSAFGDRAIKYSQGSNQSFIINF